MKLLDTAKRAVLDKDFAKLEDIWTEMVLDESIELASFFEVCDKLKKVHASKRALPLLEMLADQHTSNKTYTKALEVYKKMLYFSKQNTELRVCIIDLYRKSFPESTHLNEYLDLSGLINNDPILKAIAKLDEFLKYDVGEYFYFERYGFGEVIDTIPDKKEIIIDFEKKKRHFLSLVVAQGVLIPVTEGSFLNLKYKNISTLKQMSQENPVQLIKMMLKDLSEPLSASQIKQHLDGIVEKKQLGKWWEKARKKLEKDENIRVSGRTAKLYTYTESNQDKDVLEIVTFKKANLSEKYLLAEEFSNKAPGVFEKILPELVKIANRIHERDPGVALDILMLCENIGAKVDFTFSKESLLKTRGVENIILHLNSIVHQTNLLALIEQNEPDSAKILKKLMLTSDNSKFLEQVAKHLESAPDILKDVYYTIFSFSKKYPAQYQWMLKRIQAGRLPEYLSPGFLPRLIDSLDYVKGIKGLVWKILNLESFDKIIAKANLDEAKRILEAVNSNRVLENYKQKDYARIIEYHHPNLFKRKIDIIYTTEQALKNKQDELQQLMSIQIPENKKEIRRAREFGDLSENFEYKAARQKQAQLYGKVRIIESELNKAQIITPDAVDTTKVSIGTKVMLKNLIDEEQTHYTILGRWDTDLDKNIISNEAPVAQALLKHAPGEKITINKVQYEIVRIEKAI